MKSQYTEYDVMRALDAMENGKSCRTAALEWGVPKSTLHRRLNHNTNRQVGAEYLQRLPSVIEDRLAKWTLTQESLGYSITHAQLKVFGERLCKLQGDDRPLGKRWVKRFLVRHPGLKTKRQITVDSVRVNGATADIIQAWFQNFEIPAIKEIKPQNRWNMDEAGIMEGQGLNGLVLGSSERRFVQKKQPGSRNWTSFIEAISAVGEKTDPLVIYKGKSVQQQWFPANISTFGSWQFTATENGWTTDATALEWLEKVFIPQTTPRDDSARLLILDGHGSHETDEFMFKCLEYNIYLLYLPAHSSHVLQPLDLSIFSPLKAAYRKELNLLSSLIDSAPIGKRNFLLCYYKARESAITAENIMAGWKATGFWPLRIEKPLMSRLLLENSNKAPTPVTPKRAASDWNTSISSVEWTTPKAGKDLRLQFDTLTRQGHDDLPTRRQLFRKAVKSLDEKNFDLIQAERRIKELEAQLDRYKPRKRRKVQVNPNSRFVDAKAIKEAQIQAGAIQIDSSDSELSTDTESIGDCIEVEVS